MNYPFTPERVLMARHWNSEKNLEEMVPCDAMQIDANRYSLRSGMDANRVVSIYMSGSGGPFGFYDTTRDNFYAESLSLTWRQQIGAGTDAILLIRYYKDAATSSYLYNGLIQAAETAEIQSLVIPLHGLLSQAGYPMIVVTYTNVRGYVSVVGRSVKRVWV